MNGLGCPARDGSRGEIYVYTDGALGEFGCVNAGAAIVYSTRALDAFDAAEEDPLGQHAGAGAAQS